METDQKSIPAFTEVCSLSIICLFSFHWHLKGVWCRVSPVRAAQAQAGLEALLWP